MDTFDLLFRILFKKTADMFYGPEPLREEPAFEWGRCVECGLTLPANRMRRGRCPNCFRGGAFRVSKPVELRRSDPLVEAYAKLGCRPSDPDATVQSKYREIAKICHPDRVDHESKKEAEDLFRELTAARDLIMESRKSG
jgi:hypothetical protein